MRIEVTQYVKIQGDAIPLLLCLLINDWHNSAVVVLLIQYRITEWKCQDLGCIYERGVCFFAGSVWVLWPRSWQKCGPYVMLAKITRLQHIYNVSEGLEAPYRHIRDILFHRFHIVFHRYVKNTILFFNTFLIVFYCFLTLFWHKSIKKDPCKWGHCIILIKC